MNPEETKQNTKDVSFYPFSFLAFIRTEKATLSTHLTRKLSSFLPPFLHPSFSTILTNIKLILAYMYHMKSHPSYTELTIFVCLSHSKIQSQTMINSRGRKWIESGPWCSLPGTLLWFKCEISFISLSFAFPLNDCFLDFFRVLFFLT